MEITINTFSNRFVEAININLFFNTVDGVLIFATCSSVENFQIGKSIFKCVIPKNTLNDNVYVIDIMVVENAEKPIITIKEAITIEGVESKREGSWLGKFPGLIRPQYFTWKKIAYHG